MKQLGATRTQRTGTGRVGHWPEYLIEAAGLRLFMLMACTFGTLHPASPVVQRLPDPLARRSLMGVAMGLTAVALIYSPWGRRSGAHFNPATTLTFWRLGKLETTWPHGQGLSASWRRSWGRG